VGGVVQEALAFLVDSLRTVARRRDGHMRLVLLLGMFNFMCYIFTYNGTEGTHRYYYAQFQYGWSEQEMSSYLFVYRIGYLIALWCAVPALSAGLKLADTTIAILASTASAAGFLMPALGGVQEWARWGSWVINWFSVGSWVCLMSPATTITTRFIFVYFTDLQICQRHRQIII